MKKLITRVGVAVVLTAACAQVLADDAAADQKKLEGSVELGAVVTTGNTDSSNVKFRADSKYNGPRMKHTAHIDGLRQTEDGNVNAEKYYAYYQADYKLDEIQSLFGRVSYEDDRFSGFDYQTNFTLGYSRQLLQRDNMSLNGSVGAGLRHSKLDDGSTKDEAVTRLALDYDWQISESAEFTQGLSAEIGENSTITRSETALQSSIIGNLAMKLAFNVKHQTEVPVGTKKTDTETSVTLVYHF